MVQKFTDPVLSADERAVLRGAADPLKRARGVLEKLENIGFDVADDLAQVDHAEQLRSGLLDQFGRARPARSV